MENDTTRNLSKVLEHVNTKKEEDDYIKAHTEKNDSSFANYLNAKIASLDIPLITIVKRSGISKNYVYCIFNGTRNPSRDKVIALCIASEMTYKETQRSLELSGFSTLYPKDERDIRIAVSINNGIHNVAEVNLLLDDNNLGIIEV